MTKLLDTTVLPRTVAVPNMANRSYRSAVPNVAARSYRSAVSDVAARSSLAAVPDMSAVADIEIFPGSVLTSPTAAYMVKSILGSGTYGKVVLCMKAKKNKDVAIKIMKYTDHFTTIQEIKILRDLSSNGGDQHNIISLMSSFMFDGRHCLEFEHLDISLSDFQMKCGQLSLFLIRPILQQLASGLKFLRDSLVIHGDLKALNVMMVDHKKNLQLKIIDFGFAKQLWETSPTDVLQTLWYRAPEVFLGLDYSTAVDLWSLGCMAVEMLLGEPLFLGRSEHDMLRHITQTVALPPNDLLEKGLFTEEYFQKETVDGAITWELRPMMGTETGERSLNSLEDLFTRAGLKTADEELDCKFFTDLVAELLMVDPRQRMSAERVLEHPFISMSHLKGVSHSLYTSKSVEMMKQNTGRSEEEEPSTSSNLHGPTPSSGSKKRRREEEPLSDSDSVPQPPKKVKKTELPQELPPSNNGPTPWLGSRKRKREEVPLSDSDSVPQPPKKVKKTELPQELPPSNNGPTPWLGSRKRRREEEPLSDSDSVPQPPRKFKKTELPQELPPSNNGPTPWLGSRKRRREEEPLSDSDSPIPKRYKKPGAP